MRKTLHILLVSYEFPPEMATGGIGTYMHHLAGLLHKHGHRVTVFSATLQGSNVRVIDRGYCSNYLIPSADNEQFRQAVLPVFRELLQTQVVDVMESPEVGACALEIKKAYPGIPLIVKLHTPGVLITRVSNSNQSVFGRLRYVAGALRRGRWDLGHWAKKARNKEDDAEYQICTMADQLLSPSNALAKWASKFWGLPLQRISIVSNPFVFDQELIKQPLKGRPKQICFIGKLSILKGAFLLKEAIPMILEQNPDYRIVLVGRDEPINGVSTQEELKKSLVRYDDKIVFTGPLSPEKVAATIGQSRICLVPSLWENFPNVVLEAMAGGAAVVATNNGGVPEMVRDGVTGNLFNPTEAGVLSQKVARLIQNEGKRLSLVERAREEILTNYQSWTFESKVLAPYRVTEERLVHAG